MIRNVNPLVSVIIPVYNVEKYLEKCMNSVLEQTYTNLEIILIDDGSTDQSGIMCDIYAERDARVKVIHKQNGGLSEARNWGLDNMTGEFLVFVDSDDYIHKDFVARLLDYIIEKKCDVVAGGYIKTITEINDTIENIDCSGDKVVGAREAVLKLLYRKGVPGYAWGKMYCSNLFKEIRFPVGKLFEDGITTYKVLKKTTQIGIVDYPVYYYRQRLDSIVNVEYKPSRMDAVYHAMQILEDVEDDTEYKRAAEAYVFFAVMDNYSLVNSMFVEDKKNLEKQIRKYRGVVFRNKKAGMALRIMALIAYFPSLSLVRYLGKVYKQINYKKWIKEARKYQ